MVGGIVIGKKLPDVGHTRRRQKSVRHGMQECIAIAVGDRPAVKVQPDAPDHERPPLAGRGSGLEAVEVVPVTDPD